MEIQAMQVFQVPPENQVMMGFPELLVGMVQLVRWVCVAVQVALGLVVHLAHQVLADLKVQLVPLVRKVLWVLVVLKVRPVWLEQRDPRVHPVLMVHPVLKVRSVHRENQVQKVYVDLVDRLVTLVQ